LTKRAIAALQIDGEITETGIEAAIEEREDEISDALNTLDSEYYQQTENIAERLFKFIKANKTQIDTKA
jgi:hypothetical protein